MSGGKQFKAFQPELSRSVHLTQKCSHSVSLSALPGGCVSVMNIGEEIAIGIFSDTGFVTLKARIVDRQIKPALLLSHRDIDRCASQRSSQPRQFVIG